MNDAKIYYAARIEGDGGAAEIDGAHVVLEEDYEKLSRRCDKLREALWDYFLEVEALYAERDRLREALRATDALLDPAIPEHRERIEDNAELIAEGGQDD
jgi:hypothetical protein